MNLNKTKYLCIGETHSNLKLDQDSEIESCQEYKYPGVIFYTSGTDDKEIRSRVIQARKCIACLNGILWSKDIRKEGKLNIYNALIKSSLLYGFEKWRLTENNKRRAEATEMDALRRSSRIHSFSSLSYDRSKASSKASSPHSAIQSFLFQMRVSSPFLKVIQ